MTGTRMVLAGMLVALAAWAAPAYPSTLLSVGIALERKEAEISGSHGVRLLDPATGKELGKSWGKRSVDLRWDSAQEALVGPDLPRPSQGVLIRPMIRGRLVHGGREYRGQMMVRPDPQGGLMVVNLVDLEDYLLGVLPNEMSPSAPTEALKAQAVASRTYALKHSQDFAKRGFGLKASEGSQVYKGISGEDPRTTRAVEQTRGKVLRHSGDLVHAWFSASCGGRTAANESVWAGKPRPYARPVTCGFCRIFPSYHWRAEIGFDVLGGRLREVGRDVGSVRGVDFRRSKAGRIVRASIRGSRRSLELTGNEFRILAGHRLVRSLRFVNHDDPVGDALEAISAGKSGTSDEELIQQIIAGETRLRSGKALRLEGTGYGHGVGLCQWGARGMAEQGHPWETILERYYTGARIEDAELHRRAGAIRPSSKI
jgi:stage II sporulation protein D